MKKLFIIFLILFVCIEKNYSQGYLGTRPIIGVTALPAVCAVAETAFLTTATAGQNLYGCTSTNTWTALAGSGSGGASTPATANLLKGNGSANGVVAATPGTDYIIPNSSVAFTGLNVSSSAFVLGSDGAPVLTPSGSQPTCAVGQRGKLWFIQSASGTADSLQVCAKSSSNTYSWLQIF